MRTTARRISLSDHIHPVSAQLGTMSPFRRGKQIVARQRFTPADEKTLIANEAGHDDLIFWLAYREPSRPLCFGVPAIFSQLASGYTNCRSTIGL